MSSKRRIPWLAGVASAALFAGCSEGPTTPDTLSNPIATSASVAAFDSAFAAPAVRSLMVLAGSISPTAPAGLARAAALLGVTQRGLPRPGESPYAWSARRAQLLRQMAPQFSAPRTNVTIIPDSLRGSVFRWDSAASEYYRAQTTGGPPNGVRFILYAVNDSTGQISYPLSEIGYAELLDESTPTSLTLHILVKTIDGSVTHLDHTVAVTPGASGFSAITHGFVSNGLSGADRKTLTFGVSFSASATETNATATVAAELNLNNPGVTIRLAESHTFTSGGGAVAVDFIFATPGETIQLQGVFTVTSVAADSMAVTIIATIMANGQVLATVEGTPPDRLTFRDKDGNALPAGPVLDLLGRLTQAVGQLHELIRGFFSPVGNIFGGF